MAVAEKKGLSQNEIDAIVHFSHLEFNEFIDDPESPAFLDIPQNAFMSTKDYFDEGGSELALNLSWVWKS